MMNSPGFCCSQDVLSHGYKELCIPAAAGGRFEMEKHALHIWPRGKYMLIALPNPDGTFTCTLFLPQEGQPSFASLDSIAKARAFFTEVFADALERMPTFDADFQENPTSALTTSRCGPWQQNGHVCLLGDAAHAVVPFYGQGLNAGFQDCTVLNNLLDENAENWEECLKRFSDDHKKNGDAIADLALHNFIVMRDLVNDARFNLQKAIERQIHGWYPDYVPLYSMVSFTHTPYAKAVEYGKAQDRLMEGILELPDIEQRINDPEMETLIREKVEAFLSKRQGVQAGE